MLERRQPESGTLVATQSRVEARAGRAFHLRSGDERVAEQPAQCRQVGWTHECVEQIQRCGHDRLLGQRSRGGQFEGLRLGRGAAAQPGRRRDDAIDDPPHLVATLGQVGHDDRDPAFALAVEPFGRPAGRRVDLGGGIEALRAPAPTHRVRRLREPHFQAGGSPFLQQGFLQWREPVEADQFEFRHRGQRVHARLGQRTIGPVAFLEQAAVLSAPARECRRLRRLVVVERRERQQEIVQPAP